VDPAALLLDVEGTTTPVDFVHTTLFSFARERLHAFLAETWSHPETRQDVERLRAEHVAQREAAPAWRDDPAGVAAYALWLMDRDRKATGLKSLQGRIWERGYRDGVLVGPVYPDVRPAFERWTRAGRRVAIFSSGSALAQRLIFGHSSAGDLTPFLCGYFDTTVGPKCEAESYGRIAAALGVAGAELVFVSDVAQELDAAASAGLQCALCVRDGGDSSTSSRHRVVRSFDDLP
jgi:enolase-phosphatase E1